MKKNNHIKNILLLLVIGILLAVSLKYMKPKTTDRVAPRDIDAYTPQKPETRTYKSNDGEKKIVLQILPSVNQAIITHYDGSMHMAQARMIENKNYFITEDESIRLYEEQGKVTVYTKNNVVFSGTLEVSQTP